MAPKVIINYQSNNLRYALQELTNYELCTWQANTNSQFVLLDKMVPSVPNDVEHYAIKAKDRADLATQLRKIINENNIDHIFPLYNDMLLPHIHDLLGITKDQCDILSNKENYTAHAYNIGIPVPMTHSSLRKTFPVVAKPANGTGGIGIKVLQNWSQYKYFLDDIHYNDLDAGYIFQEYIEGPTVSVSGRVVNGKFILDCIYDIEISELPYRAETGFTWPSKSSVAVQCDIGNYCKIMCESLDYQNGPFMADFVVRNEIPYLVDFSPRLSTSGQTIVKYSANCDYNKIVMDSIAYKSDVKVQLDKSVVFRYFNLEKGEYDISMQEGAEYSELQLPKSQQYLRRLDMLVGLNGYAITTDKRLLDAELKWKNVLAHINIIKRV